MAEIFLNKNRLCSFLLFYSFFFFLLLNNYSAVSAATVSPSLNGGGNSGYDLNYLSEQAKNLSDTFNKDYGLSAKAKTPTATQSRKTISTNKQNKQENSNGKKSLFSIAPAYKSIISSIADIPKQTASVFSSITNIPRQTASIFSSILSPVGDFISGFFINEDVNEDVSEIANVPSVKKTSSSRSSASFSSVILAPRLSEASSERGKAGTQDVPNSFSSAPYNLPPKTYNLSPDITRKEVETLIQQSDDRNLALIRAIITAPSAVTNSESLSVQQSIDNLSRRISVVQENNIRQTDHVYNSISRSFDDISSLDGVTMTNSSFSGTTGTFSGLLTGADGTFSGDLTVSSELTVSGTGTSTISGRILATKAPTLAHSFSVWDTDTANSNVLDSSILINPSSAVADSNLFGIAVNGNVKFLVDAEGDVFVRNLTATGTVNQANTSISTLTVENTATFGDAVGDSITINAGTITSVNPISWNLPNSQTSALNFESGLFNLDTSNSRVGIGTSSPGTILSVSGVGNFAGTGSTLYSTLTAPYFTATSTTASTFPYASTTALTVSGNSYLGTVSSGAWNGSLLSVPYGGTGWSAIQSGSIPYGNGTSALSTTTEGTSGNILALLNGVPTWTATTTLSDITGTLSVSKGGTGQSSFGQGWINSDGTTFTASTSPTMAYLTATSTTATSTFAGGLVARNLTLGFLRFQPCGSYCSHLISSDYYYGGVQIKGGTQAGNANIELNYSGEIILQGNNHANGDVTIAAGNASGANIFMKTGGVDRLYVDYSGKIGIGTTSPYAKLSVVGETVSAYFTATTSTASTFPYASTTALTVSGNSYLGTVSSGTWNGSLLSVPYGGTGWSAIQSGSIPYGNGTSALSTTTAGTSGNILALLNGIPTWTATTTLSDITGTLSVSKGGTGQSSFGQGWINSDGTTFTASTSPTVAYLTATSTTATSTFAGGMTIATGGGNVGLGCSNPDHIFEIGGTGTGCNTGAGSYLNAVGDLAFTANSSREWKENIATYGKADILSRIKNAPVRTFDWKPEYCPSGNCLDKLGFIAEEFYGVLERGDDKHINGQDVTMALWLGMQNFINVFDIASATTGTPALLIDALGNWKIGNDGALTVKEVRTEKLCVGSVCVTEEQFRTVFGSPAEAQGAQAGGSSSSSSASSQSSSSVSVQPSLEAPPSSETTDGHGTAWQASSLNSSSSSSVSSAQSSSESSASISSASSETASSSSSSISSAGVEELTSSSESSSSEAVSSSSSLSSESSSSSEASSSELSSSTSSSSDSSVSSSSSVAESSSSSSESASSEASI